MCGTSLSTSRPLLFFLILLSCFSEYDLKGGTSLSFDETLYHRHIICMCVCKLISRNGLNQYCSIQTVSHGSPPFVGAVLCGRKNVLFSAQSNKKSVKLGTLPVFDFCHQTPCEKHPSSFSRMRSKGSRFTLGVWGLRVRSLHVAFTSTIVRNSSQPFATVRVRAACKRGHFWRFQSSRGFVSRGRRGTS